MTDVPVRARAAAVLLLIYGALVLANAVYAHMAPAAVTPAGLFRAAVRIIGIVLIAIGLLRGAHWAWLAAVVFGGFWLLMGIVAVAAVATAGDGVGVSISGLFFVVVGTAMLAVAWALLLTREVRQAYRSR